MSTPWFHLTQRSPTRTLQREHLPHTKHHDERESLGLGKMDTLHGDRCCSVDRCQSAAAAFLAEQALCLNHFVARCYDQLDRMDPRGRRRPLADAEQANARDFVAECSDQTLNICLQREDLSNLERGRLLDILLWAGELYAMIRPTLSSPIAGPRPEPQAGPARLAFAKR
jgi:hypothetical protein